MPVFGADCLGWDDDDISYGDSQPSQSSRPLLGASGHVELGAGSVHEEDVEPRMASDKLVEKVRRIRLESAERYCLPGRNDETGEGVDGAETTSVED